MITNLTIPALRRSVLTTLMLLTATIVWAQSMPAIFPTATYTVSPDKEEMSNSYSGSAPLPGRFQANPENTAGWDCYYEWRFTLEGETEPYLIRYEENTEYTFTDAGTHNIVCYAVFTQGNDTVAFTDDYWNEVSPLTVTISESKLEMPNAFSPNGDEFNELYQAKSNYQSIVEFHAVIYNRWGQKLYEWDDPSEGKGWDGTYKGSPVKEGVYFVQVTARGADGRKYHIRRDVNLLRGFTDREGSSGGSTGQ